MENFLNRLNRNPYAPIDGASVTRVDELGNGYDDFGQMIQPKFQAPEQTWGETALGVATAPARIATALADSVSPYGSEGWRMPPIVNEGVNALSAVGDAYNYGMDQDEINSRALGMAGFMMGGGGLAARPAGGTGMFAGRLAKTADQEALARAERMAAEGADRRAIWDSTGWFQGPDSKWRFEIDDSGATYNPTRGATQVGHALNHPDLAAAYPDVPGVKLNFSQKAGGGAYFNDLDRIGLGNEVTPKDQGILLHELQHRVQKNEGFGRGGSYAQSSGSFSDPDYRMLSGEVESRNVERRLNMSADERRATPPWETQDIPFEDQIVRLYSNASKEGALPALHMGQEARLARARDMGFDTDKTYYHGTQAGGIQAFDMGRADTGWRGKAVHMADDPKLAEFYGGDRYSPGAIYPLHLRVNNTADYMGTNLPRDVFSESQLADITSYWGAGQADGFFGSGKMTPELASGGIGHDAMMDLLKSQGYDSLMDNGHMMVFDPRNIRSVNAAFDPAKSDSANLLAANADSRPALLGAGQEQDIPDWLLPYLGR